MSFLGLGSGDMDEWAEPTQAEREAICAERGHYVLMGRAKCLRCLADLGIEL